MSFLTEPSMCLRFILLMQKNQVLPLSDSSSRWSHNILGKAFRPSVCLNHEEFSLEFYLLKYKMLDNLSFKNPSSWPRLSISTQSTFIRFTGTSNQKEVGWKAYKNLFFLIQVALSQPIWKPYVFLLYQCITEKVPNYISHGAVAESTLFCSLPQNHHLHLQGEYAHVVVSPYLPGEFALIYVQWDSCVCLWLVKSQYSASAAWRTIILIGGGRNWSFKSEKDRHKREFNKNVYFWLLFS